MLELVQRYYLTERQSAFLGAAIGGALLLGALLLWRSTTMTSFLKGMAYALVVSGFLLASSSLGYSVMVSKRATLALAKYTGQSDDQIRRQEVIRMKKVLASGYMGGLAAFTGLLLIGLVLIFTAQDGSPWKGVALTLLITGVLGHAMEAYSKSVNQQYLRTIRTDE